VQYEEHAATVRHTEIDPSRIATHGPARGIARPPSGKANSPQSSKLGRGRGHSSSIRKTFADRFGFQADEAAVPIKRICANCHQMRARPCKASKETFSRGGHEIAPHRSHCSKYGLSPCKLELEVYRRQPARQSLPLAPLARLDQDREHLASGHRALTFMNSRCGAPAAMALRV
jgi:hypothetical protein